MGGGRVVDGGGGGAVVGGEVVTLGPQKNLKLSVLLLAGSASSLARDLSAHSETH